MSKKSKQKFSSRPSSTQDAPTPFAMARRGEKAFKRENYPLAIKEWEQLLQDATLKPSLRKTVEQSLAEAYFRHGQNILFSDAIQACKLIESAAGLHPNDAIYAYHAGLAFHRHNLFDKAIEWYRETLLRKPDFQRAYYPLALALAEGGQDVLRDPVWNHLDEVQRARVKGLPGDDPISQGLLHVSQEDWNQAQEILAQVVAEPGPPLAKGLAYHYLGVIALQQGDEQSALQHLQQARKHGLTTGACVHNLVSLSLKQIEQMLADKNIRAAMPLVEFLREYAPDELPEEIDHATRFMTGYTHAMQGKWQEAITYWEPLREISGIQGLHAAANVAVAYEKLEEWEKAADAWRESTHYHSGKENNSDQLQPEQMARLWSRIAVLYKQALMPEEAIKTLENALQYQPDDPVLLLAIAHYYINQESYDSAKKCVEEVLSNSPQNGEALMLKAMLAEIKPSGFKLSHNKSLPGIKEWEQVEQLDDETYAPIARQRLSIFYQIDYMRHCNFERYKEAGQVARKYLERNPHDQLWRSQLAYALVVAKAKQAEIVQAISQVDLSDTDALHQLVDAWHMVKKPEEAQALLDQVEASTPLPADFFIGIARCAFGRHQPNVAEAYIEEALQRAKDPTEIKRTKTDIGHLYLDNDKQEQGKAIWEAILEEDRYFGPALHAMALIAVQESDFKLARRYLNLAERWAKANKDTDLLEDIQEGRAIIAESMFPYFRWDY
ncbi:MAG: tetratricopeptide repeat protein [Anaerolineae bacterium]|nr:tetratricopeptide repeat protein [Anaerolineae bacterium]